MTGRQPVGAELAAGATVTRRAMLSATVATLIASGCAGVRQRPSDFSAQLTELQAQLGGRIGVYALDTGSGLELRFNSEQRFAMCSTFKLLLAAAILARVDAGQLALDQQVKLGPEDMIAHAPVTAARVAQGSLSVRELAAAAVEVSDNPAANLLLELIDGPIGLTRTLRAWGDEVTRLDRWELQLNSNLPGDPRDTTTPHAIAHDMRKLLTADVLSLASRTQLCEWLVNSRTGVRRMRAGLPATWKAGDKTGTGANGAVNDALIAWPPGRSALIAAVYMSESAQPISALEAGHARIGQLIATAVMS